MNRQEIMRFNRRMKAELNQDTRHMWESLGYLFMSILWGAAAMFTTFVLWWKGC